LDLKYLFYPAGVAIDPHGNVIVADFSNHRIRKITPAGVVSTLAGSGINGFRDGPGVDAQFTDPSGLAVDAAGNAYVADEGNNRIRKIAPDGIVTTLAGTGARGFRDGAAAEAQFAAPMGIAVDPSGDIFVADSGNHRIREITPAGIVTSLTASTSGARGPGGADALFQLPTGVAVDARGDVYVADAAANQIQRITLR
jgi:DNA-binding beta-propeller fold protein YncE